MSNEQIISYNKGRSCDFSTKMGDRKNITILNKLENLKRDGKSFKEAFKTNNSKDSTFSTNDKMRTITNPSLNKKLDDTIIGFFSSTNKKFHNYRVNTEATNMTLSKIEEKKNNKEKDKRIVSFFNDNPKNLKLNLDSFNKPTSVIPSISLKKAFLCNSTCLTESNKYTPYSKVNDFDDNDGSKNIKINYNVNSSYIKNKYTPLSTTLKKIDNSLVNEVLTHPNNEQKNVSILPHSIQKVNLVKGRNSKGVFNKNLLDNKEICRLLIKSNEKSCKKSFSNVSEEKSKINNSDAKFFSLFRSKRSQLSKMNQNKGIFNNKTTKSVKENQSFQQENNERSESPDKDKLIRLQRRGAQRIHSFAFLKAYNGKADLIGNNLKRKLFSTVNIKRKSSRKNSSEDHINIIKKNLFLKARKIIDEIELFENFTISPKNSPKKRKKLNIFKKNKFTSLESLGKFIIRDHKISENTKNYQTSKYYH